MRVRPSHDLFRAAAGRGARRRCASRAHVGSGRASRAPAGHGPCPRAAAHQGRARLHAPRRHRRDHRHRRAPRCRARGPGRRRVDRGPGRRRDLGGPRRAPVVLAPALIARERPREIGRLARGRGGVRPSEARLHGAIDARPRRSQTTYEIGAGMSTSEQKVMQYLDEALATELALVRVLQSQIAMTPGGSYRDGLERHLDETRDHARRVNARLEDLGRRGNPLTAAVGLVESVIGQAVALGKTPFDLLRGSGGEEKVLKNAKDACATEALEIATYTALERLARSVGDDDTAKLAASIRADEEKMLQRVLRELPKLTDAVVGADIKGDPTYDLTDPEAADAVRKASAATKRRARTARKVPGVAQAEGEIKGAVAGEGDLAIARYDSLTAEEIAQRLSELSQIDLAKVDAYERKHENRSTVLSRISTLRTSEPWPGYDELTVAEVQAVLSEGDDDRLKQVRTYERAHKNRAGVLQTAERELSNA